MVRCHHPSHNSITWASISTATLGAAPHVRRTVSRCFAALRLLIVMYVVTSPTTTFVLSWSRSSTRGLIMATSCLLGFLPIFNDVYSPYSTPQLVWYSGLVAMTTGLTHSRYCTGCVCQNGSILNWRLWHTECWTVWRHRIWTNLFLYLACQVVATCGRRSRCSWTSHSTVCQQPAVACFLSQPPFSGTLCQMMCSMQRLFQADSCFTGHFLTL